MKTGPYTYATVQRGPPVHKPKPAGAQYKYWAGKIRRLQTHEAEA